MTVEVVICEPVRTPIGRYDGMFKSLTAVDLGVAALTGLLQRTGIPADAVEDVVVGHCYPSMEAPAIGRVLLDFASVSRGPGLVVIFSDFFDPAGVVDGLRYLLHRRLTPAVVQILSPEELNPLVTDDAELVDIEAADAESLLVNQETVAEYRTQLTEYRASLAGFCANHGLPWMPVGSSDSFAALLQACHRAGLLAGQG